MYWKDTNHLLLLFSYIHIYRVAIYTYFFLMYTLYLCYSSNSSPSTGIVNTCITLYFNYYYNYLYPKKHIYYLDKYLITLLYSKFCYRKNKVVFHFRIFSFFYIRKTIRYLHYLCNYLSVARGQIGKKEYMYIPLLRVEILVIGSAMLVTAERLFARPIDEKSNLLSTRKSMSTFGATQGAPRGGHGLSSP